MNDNKKNTEFQRGVVIGVVCCVAVVFVWAFCTGLGFIPNFFGIDAFEPEPISAPVSKPVQRQTRTNSDGTQLDLWKPVIYVYPEKPIDVRVRLDYNGEIIADYPDYNYETHGWDVFAYPDGHLINKADNKEYSYLFWEGRSLEDLNYDLTQGFVVPGDQTKTFLQDILPQMGLTPKEYNEFIVFWYPKMKNNKYNLIHFAGTSYTDTAPLHTTPPADSMLRVFMVFKPLENNDIEVTPQTFDTFSRNGLTVVEWGGVELK